MLVQRKSAAPGAACATRRKVVMGLATLAGGSAIAACAGPLGGEQSTKTKAPATIWVTNAFAEEHAALMEAQANRFMARVPHITVKFETVGGGSNVQWL